MYKIYINETPLYLTNTAEKPQELASDANILQIRYPNKSKFLLNYIDMLEKTDRYDALQVYANDLDKLKADFKSLYIRIDAAGGLVYNEAGQALVIFRRGFWDLPKGKIDPGEGKKTAAIREVQEETGLQHIELTKRLHKTRHTYKDRKGKRILKYTYWYLMNTSDFELTPQTEEDIEIAKWVDIEDFINQNIPIYKNIVEVIQAGLEKK